MNVEETLKRVRLHAPAGPLRERVLRAARSARCEQVLWRWTWAAAAAVIAVCVPVNIEASRPIERSEPRVSEARRAAEALGIDSPSARMEIAVAVRPPGGGP